MSAASRCRALAAALGRAAAGLLSIAVGCEIYEGRSIDLFADSDLALECREPIECPRERALCSRGGCVECLSSADCPGGKPTCDEGRCVECTQASHCASTENCNTALSTCALRCSEPSDCAGQAAVLCSADLALCIECRLDADCTEPRAPACDRGGRCVECTQASHCPEDKPACNLWAARCVECTSDTDCDGRVCDGRDNRCVECKVDQDCPGGSCDGASRSCRFPCTAPGDCDLRHPQCDADTGLCVECLSESDCSDPRKPVCRADRRCAECSGDADCTEPGKPACVAATGKCAECTRPEQCAAGASCDLEAARCVPMMPAPTPGP